MTEAKTTTPKVLAEELGTNPKALRRFLRALAAAELKAGTEPTLPPVGQGNRYEVTAKQAKAIKALWKAQHAPKPVEVDEAEESQPKA